MLLGGDVEKRSDAEPAEAAASAADVLANPFAHAARSIAFAAATP
jgi:hypothetical protein